MVDLSPELRAPSAGLTASLGQRHPARLAARADLALAADAWRGSLDRAYATARAGLDLPASVSVDGDVLVDAADEATGRSGLRVSRGSATARARLFDGVLDVRASGGFDDPFVTQSLVDRLSVLGGAEPVVPIDGRHFFGSGSTDVRVTRSLLLDLGVRADDGDDDFSSLSGDVGLRVFDLGLIGSSAWLRGQVLTGTVLEGIGGQIGWDAPLGTLLHVDVSYGLDRWRIGPSQNPSWAHRGRLALQRRFGAHWRTSLSLEAASGAGPPRAFGFLLVGYRI